MNYRSWTGSVALAASLWFATAPAWAFDETKYPDWRGKWERVGAPVWIRPGEKAPLTPQYQTIFDQTTAEQKAGGFGRDVQWRCLPPGMPRIMNAYEAMEIVVTPDTIHILISHIHDNRRIYTDGREWPTDPEPTFKGLSLGKWIDDDGDGRFETLEVETRGPFKGPRAYQANGLPLHDDNDTIIKERFYLDKNDRNVLWDEITTIDKALSRPWTIAKKFTRDSNPRPDWHEEVCAENNPHVQIQTDNYYIGADGLLMPARKDQAPPDLRYFRQSGKAGTD
jgi:hypothetical protein